MYNWDVFLLALCSPFIAARLAYQTSYYWIAKRKYNELPRYSGSSFPLQSVSRPGAFEEQLANVRHADGSFPPLFLYGAHVDGSVIVVATSPEAFRKIFTQDSLFPKFPPSYEIFNHFIGKGLVSLLDMDTWRKERKLLTPLFHFDNLSKGVTKITSVCEDAWSQLEGAIDRDGGSYRCSPTEFFADTTLRVIVNYAFGDLVDRDGVHREFMAILSHADV